MARLRPSIGLGILASCLSVFLAGCDGAGVSDLTGLFGDGGGGANAGHLGETGGLPRG